MKVCCEDFEDISQIDGSMNFTSENIINIETLHEMSPENYKIRVWYRK